MIWHSCHDLWGHGAQFREWDDHDMILQVPNWSKRKPTGNRLFFGGKMVFALSPFIPLIRFFWSVDEFHDFFMLKSIFSRFNPTFSVVFCSTFLVISGAEVWSRVVWSWRAVSWACAPTCCESSWVMRQAEICSEDMEVCLKNDPCIVTIVDFAIPMIFHFAKSWGYPQIIYFSMGFSMK